MRAFAFTDQALERYAGQFVWLAVNTEKAENSKFLTKFPINVWPTLLVIDSKSESVALRYAGGATVPQLGKLLDDGRRVINAKAPETADSLLAAADRTASQENKNAEAAKLYQQAIAKAPANWPRLGRAAEGYEFSLAMAHENERCATEALALYPRLKGTLSGANVVSGGLSCALELDEKNPARKELAAKLESDTREALDDPKIEMTGDDRSGLYQTLIDALGDAKSAPAEQKLNEQGTMFLEHEPAKAKTPEQRARHDPHRHTA